MSVGKCRHKLAFVSPVEDIVGDVFGLFEVEDDEILTGKGGGG